MSELSLLSRQPEFPKEDLSDTNAAFMEYLLRHEQSNQSYADMLRSSLRPLHVTGHYALKLSGIEVDYSQAEYEAFCEGFAAFEYTHALVSQQLYNGDIAVQKTRRLFVDGKDLADFELADRFAAWQNSHPNTHGVIVTAGAEQGETMKQLQSRAMGAEIAWELQVYNW